MEGCLWCFKSKKTSNYHEEINGDSFEEWLSNILPLLDDNCVIVLDTAPCHSRKIDKTPTIATKKKDIQKWLRAKGIDFDESLLKVQLLALVKQHKSKYEKFIIDEMAKIQNKLILRLPPYHYELNPIGLIWADAKKFVAEHNKIYKLSDVKIVFKNALQNVTPEKWQRCIGHVKQVELKMWELDNIIETQIEHLINVGDDSPSSSSSSSE